MTCHRMSDYIIVKAKKKDFPWDPIRFEDDVEDSSDDSNTDLLNKNMKETFSVYSALKIAVTIVLMTLVFSNVYLQYEMHEIGNSVKRMEKQMNDIRVQARDEGSSHVGSSPGNDEVYASNGSAEQQNIKDEMGYHESDQKDCCGSADLENENSLAWSDELIGSFSQMYDGFSNCVNGIRAGEPGEVASDESYLSPEPDSNVYSPSWIDEFTGSFSQKYDGFSNWVNGIWAGEPGEVASDESYLSPDPDSNDYPPSWSDEFIARMQSSERWMVESCNRMSLRAEKVSCSTQTKDVVFRHRLGCFQIVEQ